MDTKEKLSLLQELLLCNHPIYLWTYTPDFSLVRSNCPPERLAGDSVTLLSMSEDLKAHMATHPHMPFIQDTSLGLLYIAAFEYEGADLKYLHIVGPAFTGKNSQLLIRQELDQKNLSVKLRSSLFRQIEEIPIIPATALFQYAVMLHYCVTGEHITSDDIQFSASEDSSADQELMLISKEHRGIWMAEQQLLQMFRQGNPDYKKAVQRSSSISSGLKADAKDAVRNHKNNLLVLLTLCSRAAMEGGLNPSVAYTLNDYYAQKIESSTTTSALALLSREFLEDYMQRVRQSKEESQISRPIQSACDYISMHPTEKISLAQLAEQVGYTEYYFSHKFKKEVGKTVAEYMKEVKLEYSKILLSGTHLGMQEISDELSFGSRSYFSSTFQKQFGISPKEYREQNRNA